MAEVECTRCNSVNKVDVDGPAHVKCWSCNNKFSTKEARFVGDDS